MLYGDVDHESTPPPPGPIPIEIPPPTVVTISGEYLIEYRMTDGSVDDMGTIIPATYQVSMERETKNADDGYFYIIPTAFMKKQTLPNKFEAYKRMFNMWVYSEKKVKVKWYQSLFFRIIFMFIAALFIGPMVFVYQAISMVLQAIDPRLAAIIGLAFAIFSMNPGNLQSIINTVNSLIKVYSAFITEAFNASMEAITNEINALTEDTKNMKESLAEMWRQGMYVPLDTQDIISQDMYNGGERYVEMSYNQSDMIELAMENMLNPNARLV
jgi:hypothetical protein